MDDISLVFGAIQTLAIVGGIVLALMELRQLSDQRKTELSSKISEKLGSKEFLSDWNQLGQLQWTDIDDYMKKYDSAVNPEVWARRLHVWTEFENLGYMLRQGLVDAELIAASFGTISILVWGKWWPVIKHYRETESGPNYLSNFEYLAKEMWRLEKARGGVSPGFKSGFLMDRYRDLFEPVATAPP